MSTTYTARAQLGYPAVGDSGWGATYNTIVTTLDGFNALGALAVTLKEVPSASLNVAVAAGSYRKADGTVASYAGTASQAMTTAATNYVYLTDSGTLTVNTSGFPAATNVVRLAVVVAGASTITSITDARIAHRSEGATTYLALAGGTFADSGGVVTVETGTTNGVKIGGSSSSKLALWGATPVVQPSTTGTSTGFTAGSGTAVKDDSTFTGGTGSTAYRISDVVKALKQLGALAS